MRRQMKEERKTAAEYVKEVKRLRTYWLILGIIGFVLFIPLLTLIILHDNVASFILFFLLFLLLTISLKIRKRVLQIRIILTMNCDHRKYTEINLQLVERPFYNKIGISNYKNYFQAMSDYYDGDFVGMKGHLEGINLEKGTLDLKLQYYNLLGNYYKESNDLQGLKQTIDDVRALRNQKKFPKRLIPFYDSLETIFHRHYLVLTNDKNLLTKLFDFLATEQELLKKVSIHFEIGKSYFNSATFAQAEKHLNYVIEHGEKTYYALYAQQIIEKMNEEDWADF